MNLKVDRRLLDVKAGLVESSFHELDAIEAEGAEAFRKSTRSYLASNFAILASVEAAMDVASHLIAENGWGHPETYADLFRVLTEKGVVDEVLGERLASMARFRNLLVHQYGVVRKERVWEIVTLDRHDIRRFFAGVYDLLD